MATVNPFDLLGDDEYEDPAQIIAAQLAKEPKEQVAVAPATDKKGLSQGRIGNVGFADLPSKPLPSNQTVREAKNEGQRGGRGRGRGRGGRGYDRDYGENENSNPRFNGYSGGEDGDRVKATERPGGYNSYGSTRGGSRGGRRGGFSNGDASNDGEGRRGGFTTDGERPPRRAFERHSGTGRGRYESKREGAGRGNWGTPSDDIVVEIEKPTTEGEKIVDIEKESRHETVDHEKLSDDNENEPGQESGDNEKKDSPTTESDEKKETEAEPEEMTLEEYEKVFEEKRKTLMLLKSEERKVDLDKELESMQLLSNKKNDDEVFVKLGSDKDKRKEVAPVDKTKKSVSINEFLKPAEGETYQRSGGRGRGRSSGSGSINNRRGYGGSSSNFQAPSIEDARHFPSLGAK